MADDDSEIIAIESRPMPFGERGSWHERVWGEARLRLLPDTAERGAAFATN